MDDTGALTFMSMDNAASIKHFDKNSCKKVILNLSKQGNTFYYNYQVDGNKYPANGKAEKFKPETSGRIVLEINARNRVGLGDNSAINLNINNNTGTKVIVWIYKDDKNSSRIKMGTLKGNVKVVK